MLDKDQIVIAERLQSYLVNILGPCHDYCLLVKDLVEEASNDVGLADLDDLEFGELAVLIAASTVQNFQGKRTPTTIDTLRANLMINVHDFELMSEVYNHIELIYDKTSSNSVVGIQAFIRHVISHCPILLDRLLNIAMYHNKRQA